MFQAALSEIRQAGATLVAVSPQTPDQSLTLAEQHALEYPVLSDAGNAVAGQYGLVFTMSNAITETMGALGVRLSDYNGDESNTLPAATTFVVGQDGVIRFAAVSGDYRWRVGPQEVLAALRGWATLAGPRAPSAHRVLARVALTAVPATRPGSARPPSSLPSRGSGD